MAPPVSQSRHAYRDRIRYSRCHWRARPGDRRPVLASTVRNPGLYKPASRPAPGKRLRDAHPGRDALTVAGIQSTRRTGRHGCSQGRRIPGAQRFPASTCEPRDGSVDGASVPWLDSMFPGALAPPLVRSGRHGYSRGCRVREYRCRRRRHAGAIGENGRVDADTWFQTMLPSRKSPNLSNSRACVAAHSLFLLKNILVELIRHNRGSKSAIQLPENLPQEPSRLWLDGCRSASRSSRITPSGELENSSITNP